MHMDQKCRKNYILNVNKYETTIYLKKSVSISSKSQLNKLKYETSTISIIFITSK